MPDLRILRVFPRRTSYTPSGQLVHVGPPDLWSGVEIQGVDEVHVSCVFTWDRRKCENLAEDWQVATRGRIPVKMGGPAFASQSGDFTPNMYIREGVTFTSRGCPNRCEWCLVPKIEGDIHELPIQPGHIVQDNNLLATSNRHFASVCQMLSAQRLAANFRGGFEAARLTRWHVDQIRGLRIEEVWLASDGPVVTPPFRQAVEALRSFLPLRKVRAYVMVGYDQRETVSDAEGRLENVLAAGALPFAQPYRPPEGVAHWVHDFGRDMRLLARKWSRPAAIFANYPEYSHA